MPSRICVTEFAWHQKEGLSLAAQPCSLFHVKAIWISLGDVYLAYAFLAYPADSVPWLHVVLSKLSSIKGLVCLVSYHYCISPSFPLAFFLVPASVASISISKPRNRSFAIRTLRFEKSEHCEAPQWLTLDAENPF